MQHVAGLISKHVRKVDLCGRYGGEEFVFMMPHTPIATGMLVCERVRSAIENTFVMIEGKPVSVTITIGVTEVLPEEIEPENTAKALKKAIDEADKALYAGKNACRNRVQQFALGAVL